MPDRAKRQHLPPERVRTDAALAELRTAGRFLVVGLFNTAIGYAFILIALALGAGDYLANSCAFIFGLPIAYYTQRRFTFAPRQKASFGEGIKYALSVVVAYLLNISVLFTGRQLGHEEDPLVQLIAIGTYAAALFLLSRLIVFRAR